MKIFSRRCDPAYTGHRLSYVWVSLAFLVLFLSAGNVFSQENPAVLSFPGSGTYGQLGPGMNAPDFVLKDIAGAPFNFAVEKTRSPVLLVFFSIFCEPCRRSLADIQRFQDRFGNAGLRVVAVALDGESFRSSILGVARQEGYGFRILVDEVDSYDRFRAADLFEVTEIPTAVLVNNNGRIVFFRKGAITEGEVEKFLLTAKKP